MILAVDHIAYSVAPENANKLKKELLDCGYEIFFEELHLKNLHIKKQFMRNYKSFHNLTLFKKAGCIPIEVLNHYSSNDQSGIMELIAPCRVLCRSANINSSLEFYGKIGFAICPEKKQAEFCSFFSKLTITFTERTAGGAAKLDDNGFNCIALLTSSVEDEYLKLKNFCECSQIAQLTVNNKSLKIFFASNVSGGDIVEIFEIEKDIK